MEMPNFKFQKKFDVEQCEYKGREKFCGKIKRGTKLVCGGKITFAKGGEFATDAHCLLRYALFGLLVAKNGMKAPEKIYPGAENVWSLNWGGKKEFIAVTGGGPLERVKLGVKGHCMLFEAKFTNKEVCFVLGKLFEFVPKKDAERMITECLRKKFGAPKNIRDIVITILSQEKPIPVDVPLIEYYKKVK